MWFFNLVVDQNGDSIALTRAKEKTMSETVEIQIDNHIATINLNRPEKKNAVDMAMFEEIASAAQTIHENANIRAVVLSGNGSDFCAGIDIGVFAGRSAESALGDLMNPITQSGANFFQNAALCWRDLPVPVIAALHGSCFGAGFQIAMGADLRYAAPNVRMSIMEIKWGFIPDMGLTVTVPGTCAADKVRELGYTGKVIDSVEAMGAGLVTDVVEDPLDAAISIANEIAGKSPDAIRAMKGLFNNAWTGEINALLRYEAELQKSVMSGQNQKEAALANLQSRAPIFMDPDS